MPDFGAAAADKFDCRFDLAFDLVGRIFLILLKNRRCQVQAGFSQERRVIPLEKSPYRVFFFQDLVPFFFYFRFLPASVGRFFCADCRRGPFGGPAVP